MAADMIDMWIKFFRDAGINNSNATALYATTFAENEIQENMVGDLTRDILREIGITVMGHVLAILKHAKAVHSRAENEKIVAKTSMPEVLRTSVESSASPKRTSTATRIIEHYVRPAAPVVEQPHVTFTRDGMSPPFSPSPLTVQPSPRIKATDRLAAQTSRVKVADRLAAQTSLVKVTDRLAAQTSRVKVTDRLGVQKRPRVAAAQRSVAPAQQCVVIRTNVSSLEPTVSNIRPAGTLKVTDRLGIKKRARAPSASEDAATTVSTAGLGKQRISLTSTKKLVEDVPVKKIRRVLPEQEGSYKITMPSGSTPLTKKLLSRQVWRQTTVFDRLGVDGSVSSTTDVEPAPAAKVNSSVFARLGSASAAANADDHPVEYAGILKKEPVTSFTRTIHAASSSEPKKNETAGILANPTNVKPPSAKSRLGVSAVKPGSPGSVMKRKKVMLVKRSGERQIVYRDMVVISKDPAISKCNTLDPESRSRFRSDNIVAGRSMVQQEPEEEWEY